jgi:hypothetical protein
MVGSVAILPPFLVDSRFAAQLFVSEQEMLSGLVRKGSIKGVPLSMGPATPFDVPHCPGGQRDPVRAVSPAR